MVHVLFACAAQHLNKRTLYLRKSRSKDESQAVTLKNGVVYWQVTSSSDLSLLSLPKCSLCQCSGSWGKKAIKSAFSLSNFFFFSQIWYIRFLTILKPCTHTHTQSHRQIHKLHWTWKTCFRCLNSSLPTPAWGSAQPDSLVDRL